MAHKKIYFSFLAFVFTIYFQGWKFLRHKPSNFFGIYIKSLDFLLFRSNLIILVPLVEIISYLASLCSASGQFSGNKTTKKPKHIMIMPASFIPSNVASYKKLSMTEKSQNLFKKRRNSFQICVMLRLSSIKNCWWKTIGITE